MKVSLPQFSINKKTIATAWHKQHKAEIMAAIEMISEVHDIDPTTLVKYFPSLSDSKVEKSRPLCKALNSKRQKCGHTRLKSSDYCQYHQPKKAPPSPPKMPTTATFGGISYDVKDGYLYYQGSIGGAPQGIIDIKGNITIF